MVTGTGSSLEWAGAEAQRAIHNNDLERLTQLLREQPALLTWQNASGETLLGSATGSFGDSGDAFREEHFTRAACAELLIDAGAVVMPSVCDGILSSRANGLLQLFQRKGLLPRTHKFLSALGDLDAVRAALDAHENDLAAVNEAFMIACGFKHKEVASLLLDRCIALDADLGRRVNAWQGRSAFIDYLGERGDRYGHPWHTLVVSEARRAIVDDDLAAFSGWLEREPYLLGESFVGVQVGLFEVATYNNRERFIVHLLDRAPAMLQHPTPPPSTALGYAFDTATPISFPC